MAHYNYKKEQEKFIDEAMIKLPAEWAKKARRRWREMAKTSVHDANVYLLDLMDAIDCAIDIGASDDDLITLSVQMVSRVRVLKSEHLTRQGKTLIQSSAEFFEVLEALCAEYGVRYPSEHDRAEILARLTDVSFWLRRLRVVHAKQAEGAAIDAGLVHKQANIYVSNDTLKRRQDALKRNAETLGGINLMNADTGEIIKLSQAAAAGMANPYNRASELITRTKGFQELSEKYGHHCVFLTLTCPSRFHAVKANGKFNDKYKKANKPDVAQKYLVRCWARARAQLARMGVKFYGLRVVEPHHDGCPHWHASIWYKNKSDIRAIRKAIKDHFLRGDDCDYGERGAASNRLKFKICDARGAVGYMLKYILKNMKGLGIDGENSDEGNISSEAGAGRVEAWAATWRIRQFQQVGGHSVTVWRELRRVDEVAVVPKFRAVWLSAQKQADKRADYAAFIEAMGGLQLDKKKKEPVFKVDYDFINGRGKYGDTIIKKVLGVVGSWVYGFGLRSEKIKTNRGDWVVM